MVFDDEFILWVDKEFTHWQKSQKPKWLPILAQILYMIAYQPICNYLILMLWTFQKTMYVTLIYIPLTQ